MSKSLKTFNKMSPFKSQKRYIQNYRKNWETMREFRIWLRPYPNDSTKAYCEVCNTIVKAHLCDLRKHGAAKKHKKGIMLLKSLNRLKDDVPEGLVDNSEEEDSDEEENEEMSENNEKWNTPAVECLLRQLKLFWSDLKDGLRKKKDIFEDIATAMLTEGFNFQGEDCGKKFRNIKIRYCSILEKAVQGKEIKHRCSYFNDLHELLRNEPETETLLSKKDVNYKPDMYLNLAAEDPLDTSDQNLQYDLVDDEQEWTDAATNQLLDFILEFQDVFSGNDDNRKYPVWQTISKHMNDEGYPVDRMQCYCKWQSMVNKYNNLKAGVEKSGILPLWSFYTRIRYVTSVVNIPASESFENMSINFQRKHEPTKGVLHKLGQINVSQSVESEEDDLDNTSLKRSSNTTAIRHIQRLGENAEVWERLNDIENRLNGLTDQQELQKHTNILLTQILTELATLSSHIAPKNFHLKEGITLIVPPTDD